MAVHMVRMLMEAVLSAEDVQAIVDEWINNHNEWTEDPVEHSLSEVNTEEDGSGVDYLRGDFRFIQEESLTALLDDLVSTYDSSPASFWYRVVYHECDHDKDNPTNCRWDEKRESGVIPTEVPDFEIYVEPEEPVEEEE